MVFIPENNSIVCYPSLNEIKLNIRFKYVFIFKSSKKERNCKMPIFTEQWRAEVLQKIKMSSHFLLISFLFILTAKW